MPPSPVPNFSPDPQSAAADAAAWETLAPPASVLKLAAFLTGLNAAPPVSGSGGDLNYPNETPLPFSGMGNVGHNAGVFSSQIAQRQSPLLPPSLWYDGGGGGGRNGGPQATGTPWFGMPQMSWAYPTLPPSGLPFMQVPPLPHLPLTPNARFGESHHALPRARVPQESGGGDKGVFVSASLLPAPGTTSEFLRWLDTWHDARARAEQARLALIYGTFASRPLPPPMPPSFSAAAEPAPGRVYASASLAARSGPAAFAADAAPPDILSRAWRGADTASLAQNDPPLSPTETPGNNAENRVLARRAGRRIAVRPDDPRRAAGRDEADDDEPDEPNAKNTATTAKKRGPAGYQTPRSIEAEGSSAAQTVAERSLAPRLSLQVVNRAIFQVDGMLGSHFAGLMQGQAAATAAGATQPFSPLSPMAMFATPSLPPAALPITLTPTPTPPPPPAELYGDYAARRVLTPGNPAIPQASYLGAAPLAPVIPPVQTVQSQTGRGGFDRRGQEEVTPWQQATPKTEPPPFAFSPFGLRPRLAVYQTPFVADDTEETTDTSGSRQFVPWQSAAKDAMALPKTAAATQPPSPLSFAAAELAVFAVGSFVGSLINRHKGASSGPDFPQPTPPQPQAAPAVMPPASQGNGPFFSQKLPGASEAAPPSSQSSPPPVTAFFTPQPQIVPAVRRFPQPEASEMAHGGGRDTSGVPPRDGDGPHAAALTASPSSVPMAMMTWPPTTQTFFIKGQNAPAPFITPAFPTSNGVNFPADPTATTPFKTREEQTAARKNAPTPPTPLSPAGESLLNPRLGQITLLAPPLHVATEQAEQSGAVVRMDWKTLAGGSGPLDAGGLARLKAVLPPGGAQFIYPALPEGAGGANAANFALSPLLLRDLMTQGYGPGATQQFADAAVRRSQTLGASSSPVASPLAAALVPSAKPPMGGGQNGLLPVPTNEPNGGHPAGLLAQAGQASGRRGGTLDFLGLPVRLAPSLGGRSELVQETAARSTEGSNGGSLPSGSGQAVRPDVFGPLRNRLFPSFQSVTTEPDAQAWRKAAPAFGMRDGDPNTLLAPDARQPVWKPSMPAPQMETASGSGVNTGRGGGSDFAPPAGRFRRDFSRPDSGGAGKGLPFLSPFLASAMEPAGHVGGEVGGENGAYQTGRFGARPSGLTPFTTEAAASRGDWGSGNGFSFTSPSPATVSHFTDNAPFAAPMPASAPFPPAAFPLPPSRAPSQIRPASSPTETYTPQRHAAPPDMPYFAAPSYAPFGGEAIGSSGSTRYAGGTMHHVLPPTLSRSGGPREAAVTATPLLLPTTTYAQQSLTLPPLIGVPSQTQTRQFVNLSASQMPLPQISGRGGAAAPAPPTMLLQRSPSGSMGSTDAGKGSGADKNASAKAGLASEGGASAVEVQLLATEVYGLLKRRLLTESERRGRW